MGLRRRSGVLSIVHTRVVAELWLLTILTIVMQSFTSFEYSEMTLSAANLARTELEQDGLGVSVVVTNTGAMESKHTVLLFLSDDYRIISPEVSL